MLMVPAPMLEKQVTKNLVVRYFNTMRNVQGFKLFESCHDIQETGGNINCFFFRGPE